MRTCERHDDCVVVYDSRNCPVCAEQDDKRAEIEGLRVELDNLQSHYEQLVEEHK